MARKDFYQSKAWKENRRTYAISRNCICERCGRAVYVSGVSDESIPKEHRLRYVVHHKQYLNESNYTQDEVAMEWKQLELLCIDCHNEEHFKEDSTRKGLMFDDMGNLIPKITPPSIKRKM